MSLQVSSCDHIMWLSKLSGWGMWKDGWVVSAGKNRLILQPPDCITLLSAPTGPILGMSTCYRCKWSIKKLVSPLVRGIFIIKLLGQVGFLGSVWILKGTVVSNCWVEGLSLSCRQKANYRLILLQIAKSHVLHRFSGSVKRLHVVFIF